MSLTYPIICTYSKPDVKGTVIFWTYVPSSFQLFNLVVSDDGDSQMPVHIIAVEGVD
jgi:hypothetical protein